MPQLGEKAVHHNANDGLSNGNHFGHSSGVEIGKLAALFCLLADWSPDTDNGLLEAGALTRAYLTKLY